MPSPLISPLLLLLIGIGVTVAALIVTKVSDRRREEILTNLARGWGMQYSPRDVFNLAARVAAHLPLTGASDVRVRDVIYGTEAAAGHCCVFTAEYTAGVVRSKTRRWCVVSMIEPLQCAADSQPTAVGPKPIMDATLGRPLLRIDIAPQDLSFIEQYESLRSVNSSETKQPRGDAAAFATT